MSTIVFYALAIALILPLSLLAASPEAGPAKALQGPAVVALALGLVFFGLMFIQSPTTPGAGVFRAFYGGLGFLTLLSANVFACLEGSAV